MLLMNKDVHFLALHCAFVL